MRTNERGYTVLIVLLFVGLSGLILSGSLKRASTSAQTIYSSKVRSEHYYTAESGLNKVLSWLREYSQQIVTPFRRGEFYARFDRTSPSYGANDTAASPVPTRLKLQGSNHSAILVNHSSLGTAHFPPSKDITTNANFDVINEFANADFGNVRVRVTLLDAVPDVPAQDYGDPDLGNPPPETDFSPVYYVEAYAGESANAHLAATVTGDVIHVFDLGIYGQDYLEINQPCDSFISANNPYSSATRRAKCPAGSNSTSAIHKNNEIYGSLQTNGDIEAEPPFGGDTCADFQPNCPNKGETCAGPDCGVPLLEIYSAFDTYCPVDRGNLVVSTDTTLSVVDSDPSTPGVAPLDNCWNEVRISNNVTLTLDSTHAPYYFRTLTLQNNSNSKLDIKPDPASGTVQLWVNTITGNSFNGNQIINTGKPTEFQLYYLGTNQLTLNGTAAMNSALVAPNASVYVSGNFDYFGALLAKQLTLRGNGVIHYDESLGGTGDISNVQYKLEDQVQRYR